MKNPYMAIVVLCIWAAGAVAGYLVWRWAGRSVFGSWTRNDRMFALLFSPLYGPIMPLFGLAVVLLYKLANCRWGNQEARW